MGPTKKTRLTKKPYEIPDYDYTKNKKTSNPKKKVGGGDIEKLPVIQTTSQQDYLQLSQQVKSLENSMATILTTLNSFKNLIKDGNPMPQILNQPGMEDLGHVNNNVNDNNANINESIVDKSTQDITTNHDTTTSNVTDSIQQHLEVMMGGPSQTDTEGKIYKNIALPLDLNVNDKVKQKIWAGDFINLNTINDKTDNAEYTMKVINSTQGPSINFVPAKQNNNINNISQWLYAFDIYMIIYCKQNINELDNMMIYRTKIRNLSLKGGDWIRYDSQFRKLKAKHDLRWEFTHVELWMDCIHNPPKIVNKYTPNRTQQPFRYQRGNTKNYPSSTNTVPLGYCVKYHTGKPCIDKCKYSHKCYKEGCNESIHSYYEKHINRKTNTKNNTQNTRTTYSS
jgi:hypothetical protein